MNMECLGCGESLNPIHHGSRLHPSCTDPVAEQVKAEISGIIRWGSDTSPRSLQVLPGPSELGTPCDRRLAYRLSGSPIFNNRPDPLAAVVGTALHTWLEGTVRRFNDTFGDDTLAPEVRVEVDPLIGGTSDLYHRQLQAVVDYKGASMDVIKRAVNEGAPPGYQIQAHLYGMGYARAGLPVRDVMIAFIPRAGQLKGIYVWRAPFDPAIGQAALDRMYGIGDWMNELAGDPARFEKTPAADDCWFCPFKAGTDLMIGATAEHGCPGVT